MLLVEEFQAKRFSTSMVRQGPKTLSTGVLLLLLDDSLLRHRSVVDAEVTQSCGLPLVGRH